MQNHPHECEQALVSKLREEFPRSERVLGILIQSAPDSTSLESLEEAVPQDLLEKDEVAAALTERALDSGEMQKAEQFARTATAANSRVSRLWPLLGCIILQSEMSKSRERYGAEVLFFDTVRLSEAEEVFGEALRLAKEERSISGTVEALLHRRQTRIVLQKEAGAREDLEEARQSPREIQGLPKPTAHRSGLRESTRKRSTMCVVSRLMYCRLTVK